MSPLEHNLTPLPPGARGHILRRRVLGMYLRQQVFDLHVRHGQPLHQVARTLQISPRAVSNHWRRLQDQINQNAPQTPADYTALRERIASMLWATVEGTLPAPTIPPPPIIDLPPPTPPTDTPPTDTPPTDTLTTDAPPTHTPPGLRSLSEGGPTPPQLETSNLKLQTIPPSGIQHPARPSELQRRTGIQDPAASPQNPALIALRLKALDQISRLYAIGDQIPHAVPTTPPQYATPQEIAAAARQRMLEWRHEPAAQAADHPLPISSTTTSS
ncbi:hypothetical protein [Prosthecobacter sp.]|uniref:hypothetical protein n=1 Tax=Prosthecobacter sp. TaxID=1965333 RepID=UPI003783EFD7